MSPLETYLCTCAVIWCVQQVAETVILMSRRRDADRWAAKEEL